MIVEFRHTTLGSVPIVIELNVHWSSVQLGAFLHEKFIKALLLRSSIDSTGSQISHVKLVVRRQSEK